MKIFIREIKENGIDVRDRLPADTIGFSETDGLNFSEPVEIHAHVERAEDVVLAKVEATSKVATFCSRCMEPLKERWQSKFMLDFPVDPSVEFIEMSEDIRQEILLSTPLKFLCSQDCQGLCPGCGANLNKEKCTCKNKNNKKERAASRDTRQGDTLPTYRPFADL